MSNKPTIAAECVLIGREHWDVPVRVELRPYLDFVRRMDCQLRWLAIRWSHAASPAAGSIWDEPRGVGVESRSPQRRGPP